jgi:hypothetical protein
LADGLSLDSGSGEISGVPTVVSVADFTVRVASGDGQSALTSLTISVTPTPVLDPAESCADHPDYVIASFDEQALEAAVRADVGVFGPG